MFAIKLSPECHRALFAIGGASPPEKALNREVRQEKCLDFFAFLAALSSRPLRLKAFAGACDARSPDAP
jgi:hypothetical protein